MIQMLLKGSISQYFLALKNSAKYRTLKVTIVTPLVLESRFPRSYSSSTTVIRTSSGSSANWLAAVSNTCKDDWHRNVAAGPLNRFRLSRVFVWNVSDVVIG